MASFNDTPTFRGDSMTAVERTDNGIRIWVRETRRKADGDGVETTKLFPPVDLLWHLMSDATRAEGFGYGMETRLTRQMALPIVNGKRPTAQAKWDAVNELAMHYASGTDSWNLAAAQRSLSPETRDLINALVRALGCDADAAETTVRALSADERNALRADAEIKTHLDAIVAERARTVEVGGLKEKLRALRA